MTDPTPPVRPLAEIRKELDGLDADILALLAKRQQIVAEVAATKLAQGIRIRDVAREDEVLRERAARGEKLGLPPSVVQSIWRLLMMASRDHQAALKIEAAPQAEPRTVAILGGKGGMGKLFQGLFEGLGHRVLVVDLDTTLTAVEAAKQADVVVVTVPIRETERVVREVGPHLREDALLLDLTSLKTAPIATMVASTKASVVGSHPMFGPGIHTFQGQRVVLCRGRGDAWFEWVKATFEARGLVVTESSPEQHDRAMALVQVLTHYQTQVLGLTLARMGIPLEEPLAFTSPAYLLEAYVTARHFAQSPALYGPIEMENPLTSQVTSTFEASAREVAEILASKDQARFDALFSEVSSFFGEFTQEALEQSGFLIDRLVELTTGRAASAQGR